MSSRPVAKKAPLDVSQTSKTLTTAYAGYVSDAFFCADSDTVRVYLSLASWDGTSLELKSQVYNSDNDTWYTEVKATAGTIALDDVTFPDAVLDAESDTVILPLDVRGHERVRVSAKRTGGSTGDLTVHMSAG